MDNQRLRIHFQGLEYSELRDILLDETVMMRQSTLPNHWFVFMESDRFEKLKLSLLIDRCMVQHPEDTNDVTVSRPHLNLENSND